MTTWNELPAHLVSKIRSDSVTAPVNLPGAVPALKYGNAITEVDGIRFDSRKEAKYYEDLLWQQLTVISMPTKFKSRRITWADRTELEIHENNR